MLVTDRETFLVTLQKSGLLDKPAMARAMRVATSSTDATAVAESLVSAQFLTAWQANQILNRQHVLHLGEYWLVDRIGRGRSGNTLLGKHHKTGDLRVIRLLSESFASHPFALRRFAEEVQKLARIEHPNIVAVDTVRRHGRHVYLIQEYVDGPSLQLVVEAKGRLPFTASAKFVRQVAVGLAELHAAGILHRDIRPSHVLVDPHRTVKVLDPAVWLLIELDLSEKLNADGECSTGSVDFTAPEFADQEPLTVHTDIYSLGCTLFFLLTGKLPFAGTDAEILQKHKDAMPPSILELRPDTPSELIKLCAKMMAKQAEFRLQSAEDVISAVDQWIIDYAAAGGPPEVEINYATLNLEARIEAEIAAGDSAILRNLEPGEGPSSDMVSGILAAQEVDAALKADDSESSDGGAEDENTHWRSNRSVTAPSKPRREFPWKWISAAVVGVCLILLLVILIVVLF